MLRNAGIIASVIMGVSLFACTADSVVDRGDGMPEPIPAAEVDSKSPAATSAPDSAATNCSIVVWCNEPGARGTVCRQVGCDFNTAYNECINETRIVCGTPVQPWVF